MTTTNKDHKGSAFPPPGLNAVQYREWIDSEIADAVAAEDKGEELISHEEMRVWILEQRLKRAKAKAQAA